MSEFLIDPVHWTMKSLIAHGDEVIHELALRSSATANAYRLVVGRCLLAVKQTRLYERMGFSGASHYAIRVLGLGQKEANMLCLVASRLEELPRLSKLAELGQMSWGKLRAIVSKATVETEEFWIALASRKSCTQIEELIAATEYGKLPWHDHIPSPPTTRLQLCLSEETGELFNRVVQSMSQELGKPMSAAEVLEHLAIERLSKRPVTPQVVEAARKEARRGTAAARRRHAVLIEQARQLAIECGLGEKSDPLADALGAANLFVPSEVGRPGRDDQVEDRPEPDDPPEDRTLASLADDGVGPQARRQIGHPFRWNAKICEETLGELSEETKASRPGRDDWDDRDDQDDQDDRDDRDDWDNRDNRDYRDNRDDRDDRDDWDNWDDWDDCPIRDDRDNRDDCPIRDDRDNVYPGPGWNGDIEDRPGWDELDPRTMAIELLETPSDGSDPACSDGEAAVTSSLSDPRTAALIDRAIKEKRFFIDLEDDSWKNPRLRFNPAARFVTPAQRKELLRRDGYCCSTPGCPNHLWIEIHHMVFVSRHGKSLRFNLLSLCSRCHRNVHRGFLQIEGDAERGLIFRDANGRDLESAYATEVANWLNLFLGWSGGRDDCHKPILARAG
jgi:hypothetical protein